jgi:3-hydroxyisobutyrate dehydrogenase-like beta-hydroxyacid dehydrogenase
VAIHSTIRPETVHAVGERAAQIGVHLIDAPVSGGFLGAHEGSLAVMVGGSPEAVELVREPFSRWASLLVHTGPLGSGTTTKLARNLLHFVAFTAAGEAQRLAEAAGIPLAELARVVRHSDAVTGGPGAIMLRDTTAPMAPTDDWHATLDHVRSLGTKDLALALELGTELGVQLPLARMALDRLGTELGL